MQRDYRRVANIQHDIVQKITTKLVNEYDQIVIEDLDVKQMQMSHVASKGLQRSLFGYFRQVLTYKCEWYNKHLLLADKFIQALNGVLNVGLLRQVKIKSVLMATSNITLSITNIFVMHAVLLWIEIEMQ